MTEIENPAAFPASIGLDGSIYEGMSLRDWFAGQALAGLLANPQYLDLLEKVGPLSKAEETLAQVCASTAQAMLQALGETQ